MTICDSVQQKHIGVTFAVRGEVFRKGMFGKLVKLIKRVSHLVFYLRFYCQTNTYLGLKLITSAVFQFSFLVYVSEAKKMACENVAFIDSLSCVK